MKDSSDTQFVVPKVDIKSLGVFCPTCNTTNYGRSACRKCRTKFTEHICISCGLVWYCSCRRYEPHKIYNHNHCYNCAKTKEREEIFLNP